MRRITLILLLAVLLTSPALLTAGCQSSESTAPGGTTSSSAIKLTDTIAQATLSRYRTNEIREYQGARLDPAVGPRDNSISGVQKVDPAVYRLTIDGLVDRPAALTYDAVRQLTPVERKITLHCVEGWQATILWRGVQLSDLLDDMAVKPAANTVIFHCVDGYTTSLPLADIVGRQLILAYDANGLPLPPEMGYPFIVVAEDRQGYKWARWVTRIELSDNAAYRGYWESRGFDNEAYLE